MPSFEPNSRDARLLSPSPLIQKLTCGLFVVALCCSGMTGTAQAQAQVQAWSNARTRPPLREIVSTDATGEVGWPYGSEDVAGDGPAFAPDEAGADVRTVYASADDGRVWLRAYLSSETAPSANLVTFFFIDTDERDSTGGPAFSDKPWPAWKDDPTRRGYERAVGTKGDGTLVGVWSWDSSKKTWTMVSVRSDAVRVAVGRDEDPIRLGPTQHGYVQVDVQHDITGLKKSCDANLFVRTFLDAPAPRVFGDDDFGDDENAFTCVPKLDEYGDPAVIRTYRCKTDAECPADGRCRDDVCLFAEPCARDTDCRSDERCASGGCVVVVDAMCTQDSQCNGLVCTAGSCVACTETGAAMCEDGLSCSPNGTCANTEDFVPGSGDEDTGGEGPVRGGAFRCAAQPTTDLIGGAWLIAALSGLFLMRRRAQREGRA